MFSRTKHLHDLTIATTDDAIGDMKDIFFNDEAWPIRYLVVDAGYASALPLEREMEIAVYQHCGRAGCCPDAAPAA